MTIAPLAAQNADPATGPAQSPSAQELSGTAVLVEGTARSQGLPGFLPNRIPALSGRYEPGKGSPVSVWAVFEPLAFDPSYWQEKSVAKNRAWLRITQDRKQVWCVPTVVPMRAGMDAYSKVTFMIEADAAVPEARCLAFLSSFVDRTEFFFSSANRPGDLSFPARLDTGQ